MEDHSHQNSLDWQRKQAAEAEKKENKADNKMTPLTESNAQVEKKKKKKKKKEIDLDLTIPADRRKDEV